MYTMIYLMSYLYSHGIEHVGNRVAYDIRIFLSQLYRREILKHLKGTGVYDDVYDEVSTH